MLGEQTLQQRLSELGEISPKPDAGPWAAYLVKSWPVRAENKGYNQVTASSAQDMLRAASGAQAGCRLLVTVQTGVCEFWAATLAVKIIYDILT